MDGRAHSSLAASVVVKAVVVVVAGVLCIDVQPCSSDPSRQSTLESQRNSYDNIINVNIASYVLIHIFHHTAPSHLSYTLSVVTLKLVFLAQAMLLAVILMVTKQKNIYVHIMVI